MKKKTPKCWICKTPLSDVSGWFMNLVNGKEQPFCIACTTRLAKKILKGMR